MDSYAPISYMQHSDGVARMGEIAQALRALAEKWDGIEWQWGVDVICRQLKATQDDVYYGLTYGEAEGILEVRTLPGDFSSTILPA